MLTSDETTIIFFAMRYALGRRTYASMVVSNYIIEMWDKIDVTNKQAMRKEIKEAILADMAGDTCDVEQWAKVLDLPYKRGLNG